MTPVKITGKYRIDNPEKFRLASYDTADTGGLGLDKKSRKAMFEQDTEKLKELQERLYAHGRWAVLVVLQGMDTAGKDGVIEHVMGAVNPQGCEVHAFKAPSAQELAHDFLWRAAKRLPERGHIGIFNRSYYEEVLVVRVHPELLARQNAPEQLAGKNFWERRFADIRAFESHLANSGVLVLKFFLHISKAEQRQRLLARADEPAKRWKFSLQDIAERKLWDKYLGAYEDVIRASSQPQAPWYVVPADHKWFARLVVTRAMVEALEGLDLAYPKIEGEALKDLEKVRAALLAEAPARGRS
jgi:PPK2 family polyphosphate:nucleotide phosphotransferase